MTSQPKYHTMEEFMQHNREEESRYDTILRVAIKESNSTGRADGVPTCGKTGREATRGRGIRSRPVVSGKGVHPSGDLVAIFRDAQKAVAFYLDPAHGGV